MNLPRITAKMSNIAAKAMEKYVDFSKRDPYSSEKDAKGRLLRWADQRIGWDRAKKTVVLQGVPYNFKNPHDFDLDFSAFMAFSEGAKKQFIEEVNPLMVEYLAEAPARLQEYIAEKLKSFEVPAVIITLPQAWVDVLFLAFGMSDCRVNGVKVEQSPRPRIYSSDADGRFIALSKDELLALLWTTSRK